MPDFFAEQIRGSIAKLSKEDSRHALRVLRLKSGENIHVSVQGKRYQAVLEVDTEQALARITQELPSNEPRTRITLYQGWPKGDKLDQIVRQSTELGVHAIIPCMFARCVARPNQDSRRIERLNRIAREAAMQSGRTLIPQVKSPITFTELCKCLQQHEQALVPYELENSSNLSQVYRGAVDAAVVIGPEGGFTEEEIQGMPALPLTLGHRILRTETAGIAAIAMLLALANDF
jgi:16S rRNA (uracil1498-N3)-methyltransferase